MRNIIRGIPGTEMPAFPMPQQEADQIVAYLRSLGSAAPERALTGDPAAGRALFFGSAELQPAATCSAARAAGWGPI